MINNLFKGSYINEIEQRSYPMGTPSKGYDAMGNKIASQSSFLNSNPASTVAPPEVTNPVVTPPTKVAPPKTETPPATRSKYINPATGKYFTPEEYANYVATKIPIASDVPKYAGDAMTNPDVSTTDLTKTATNLNNARNDIATGTTDPYGVGNKSGVAYSPQELKAIEKAYAGIYDPALDDVFARLKVKKEAEAAAQKKQEALDNAKIDIDKYWATTGANKGTTTPSTISKVKTVNDYLNSKKGQDGKISWETYVAAFQKFQELGGTLTDFKNRFIPDSLMNPGNVALIPDYLKANTPKWQAQAEIWQELNSPEMKDQPDDVKAEYVQGQGFDPADFGL